MRNIPSYLQQAKHVRLHHRQRGPLINSISHELRTGSRESSVQENNSEFTMEASLKPAQAVWSLDGCMQTSSVLLLGSLLRLVSTCGCLNFNVTRAKKRNVIHRIVTLYTFAFTCLLT
eukprot:TRINITY_DN16727_c0_g1_i2.p1 TRINITY_DN16727_c0_g1~~TRINITY_DN16727_c0_g1_i2.p1  ORF type:complete len:118 (+),score=9.69 TRINITY_DN16727_c0_g1_i2:137-490(+)